MTTALALPALATAAVPAAAHPGRLDPSFGTAGEVLLRSRGYEGEVGTASLPDGRTVIASWKDVRLLLPSGKIDPGFGEEGVAQLALPPGTAGADLAAVTVDAQGSIEVAETVRLESTPPATYDPIATLFDTPSRVLIERLTPDGRPDPSFGSNGTLVTDFGLPPPSVPGHSGLPSIVDAQGMAIDPQGRIVLTGVRARGVGCIIGKFNLFSQAGEAFVARLLPDGTPDLSFGATGSVALGATNPLAGPFTDASGGVFASTSAIASCAAFSAPATLRHLLADGTVDGSFGSGGSRPLATRNGPELSFSGLDSAGRALLLGVRPGRRDSNGPNRILVRRLQTNGSLDTSFGKGGTAIAPGVRFDRERLAVEADGDILLATNLHETRAGHGRGTRLPGILLVRLRPNGGLDRSFGNHGEASVRFGGNRSTYLRSLDLVGSDRALVTAEWMGLRKPLKRNGLAFARVELGG
ncbi:MAG TPA: hypothetical protein VHU14_04725 [Solirubrobacterales bacterium]|nr:hypothetical protein [Solirubrobacterales bacterium]